MKKNKKARREARKKKKKASQGPPVDLSGLDWFDVHDRFLGQLPPKERFEVMQSVFDFAKRMDKSEY